MGDSTADRRALPYVPALDGVRGLALIVVLAYHIEPSLVPGGALAVTVFFTLSGFLITSLLLRELESTGRVDFRRFWMRRARRLVPASIATVALVAVLVATGLHSVTDGLVSDATAALTWTANWHFVTDGQTYAALFRDPSPFQHMWSLAVEEQVYLILPISTLLLAGRAARRRAALGTFFVAGIVASTIAAAWLYSAGGAGGRAYYGTDARLAEPFVGALLAVILTRGEGFPRLSREWTRVADGSGLIALAGLGVLASQLDVMDARLYQGGFLLAAVLAAVVLVAATQETVVARVLGTAPLIRLGTISYGVYLFHWPVFEWFDARFRDSGRVAVVAAELATTFALALLSNALLEGPIRRPRRASTPIFATGWANASVAALAAVAIVAAVPSVQSGADAVDLGVGVDDPVPPPPVVAMPQPQTLVTARPSVGTGQQAGAPVASEPEPVTPQEAEILTGGSSGDDWSEGRATAPPSSGEDQLRVVVIGDSLAHNLAGGLTTWAQERGDVVVYDLSVSFCPLSRGGERRWEENESFEVNPKCSWWDDPYSERSTNLQSFQPDVVIDEAAYSEMLDRRLPDWDGWRRPGDGQYHAWLIDEYDAMFQALAALSSPQTSFLTLNAPCGDFSRSRGWRRVSEPHDRVAALDSYVYPLMGRSALGDLFKELCPDGEYSDELYGYEDARPDGMHLSAEASAELARRWLGPLIMQVGGWHEPTGLLGAPTPEG